MTAPKPAHHRNLLLLLCVLALVASCGRKAPPRWTDPLRPPSVEDLSLHQRPGEVLLSWDYPQGATEVVKRFEVKRSTDGEESKAIAETRETTYLDTGIEEGKIYTYSIVAITEASESQSVRIDTEGGGAPPPPQALALRANADTLELTWEHPEPSGLFNVYRSSVPGTEFYTPLGPPVRGTTTAVRLALDAPVYFTVRALAPDTPHGVVYEGAPSNEVMLDPAGLVPEAPTGLRALPANGGTRLIWTEAPEPWVRLYHVYRAGADGAFAQIGEARTPTYTDTAPPAEGGPWTYRVAAVGPGGEGPLSEAVAQPAPEPRPAPKNN